MRFKTDENLHPEVAEWLKDHGHDAVTIWDEGLRGRADDKIAERLQSEKRAFITLDVGFGDIRAFPPAEYSGIIVLRLALQDRRHVLSAVRGLKDLLALEPLEGKLWVVDETTVRIRGASHDLPDS